MKFLKKIFFVLLTILILILVVALFVKKDYSVERNISINRNKIEVFEYVKYLKNQDNYSKWAKMDPDMEKYDKGTDGTVGFVSGWKSMKKDVGRGEQEIINITDGERIDYELRFYEPFESTEKAYMTTEVFQDSLTIVKWGFYGGMEYPSNLMLLFWDMEEIIGKDLEIGLTNLKAILEE